MLIAVLITMLSTVLLALYAARCDVQHPIAVMIARLICYAHPRLLLLLLLLLLLSLLLPVLTPLLLSLVLLLLLSVLTSVLPPLLL